MILPSAPDVDDTDDTDAGADGAAVVFWINPELVWTSPQHAWCWEGCLSVPGFRGWVRRPAALRVRGLGADGAPQEREYDGWEARSFQHEFDHLDGVLFPQRLADLRHLVRDEELTNRERWPADWPARTLLWMCSLDADEFVGQEISLKEDSIRRRAGLIT